MTSDVSLFSHKDYRAFLNEKLPPRGASRGMRQALAKKLNCQSAFVSQVISGRAHFSLEHALGVSRFLNFSDLETRYFLFLVQLDRAGTPELQSYFRREIQKLRSQRQEVKERISEVDGELSRDDQLVYYSSWHYAAIHILCSVPKANTATQLASVLCLPMRRVRECLEFLVRTQLLVEAPAKASQSEKTYHVGVVRIHLGRESPMIGQHHMNWRMKAMESLDRNSKQDLHYSLVVSLSEKDQRKIYDLLLDAISSVEKVAAPSAEEKLGVFCMDFFEVGSDAHAN